MKFSELQRLQRMEGITVLSADERIEQLEARLHTVTKERDAMRAIPGAQPAPSFADAYQGAMEEVAIWKKRALEAEDLNRKFISEINGPTHMGEPVQPAPSVPDVDALAQFIREIDGKHQLGAGALAERIVEWLAAAPEAKPCP